VSADVKENICKSRIAISRMEQHVEGKIIVYGLRPQRMSNGHGKKNELSEFY
jgi:hypothetical protein